MSGRDGRPVYETVYCVTPFMTRSLNVMPKTTEQHLIVRSDKAVACVTKSKRLRSTFCTITANYYRHEASCGLL